MMIKQEK